MGGAEMACPCFCMQNKQAAFQPRKGVVMGTVTQKTKLLQQGAVLHKPEVSVIPATKRSVESGGQIRKQKFLRVAAYCRVSTGDESQQTSYTAQKKFYTELITSRPCWTLAGIYADEAISGTSRAKRKQFNIMMEEAMGGRIDYIVTKSISRFARNTVDTLNCVRQLRQLSPPVGIYFEKENIDTLDATGELILTILSALAQDESRSISDNIRWSIQKKFQRGEVIVNLDRFLGYDKGPNGEWVINPEQAEIVRYIYNRFICGVNSNQIAKELNKMGKRTVQGCIWRADAVLRILRNEKYVGDCESQKTITKNFLNHKSIENNGEAPRYYVKNHHVGIIDRLTWERVQATFLGNSTQSAGKDEKPEKHRGAAASPFSNLTCGKLIDGKPCKARLVRMCYNNVVPGYAGGLRAGKEDKERYYYSYPVWRCSWNVKGTCCKRDNPPGTGCQSGSIYECALEQSFMEMLYRIKRDYEAHKEASRIAALFREACERADRQVRKNRYSKERLEMLELQIRELENSGNQILDALREERDILEMERGVTATMQKNYEFFIRCLMELPEENEAGLKLNINTIDVEGGMIGDTDGIIGKSPDYLRFEKGLYRAFIRNGEIDGDTVVYATNFGVSLISTGNSRNLSSFLGFRRANSDGSIEIIDEKWKIRGRGVCRSRRKTRGKGEKQSRETE